MIKFAHLASLVLLSSVISACSGDNEAPEADNTTETRMDEVDVIDGTISDDMVDVDTQQSTDSLADGEAVEGDEAGNSEEAKAEDESSEE
ncbi:hypothetical protein [Parasphingorhabdus halotolerans]|uniref:Secreted protein n=1 Tax=Parasphingorhabdus halotolerans TaxID=2725558 RepID=A0A6H2DL44_9SPHN|nr:hypothetical protein [Parasphingorhabdus halotolerans]QJB68471.1 hypothetical protein HF685_03450 [Parasphingorhabdus halotolerans]